MRNWRFITTLTLFAVLAAPHASAGERIIFDSKTEHILPKEDLDPDKMGDSGKFGNQKNSSVEAVVAPWQNPFNSGKLDNKRRKALMEALDKKNNWAFQSTDEYLGTTNLDGLDSDEEGFLTTDLDSKSSRQLAESVFYSNRRKTNAKPDRAKDRFSDNKDDFLADNDGKLTGAELLAEDGVATPSYYQHQFDSLFKSDQTLRGDRGPDALTKMNAREVAAANMVGMGDLVPEQFNRNNPSSARLQNFQDILTRPGGGASSENGLGSLSNCALNGSTKPGGLMSGWDSSSTSLNAGSNLSSAFSSADVNSTLDSLNATRSLNSGPLNFGNSGFAPSGLGGNGFQLNTTPAAARPQQRPIFFSIPKITF